MNIYSLLIIGIFISVIFAAGMICVHYENTRIIEAEREERAKDRRLRK